MKPEERLLQICRQNKLTLALAESCTGGALSARITTIPGSSDYFKGSIVCYSNFAKHKLLSVSESILNNYGPVSLEAAEAMQKGVLRVLESDVSLSITGVAGPSGGTKDIPIGTVFIAIGRVQGETKLHEEHFTGDRQDIIDQAVTRCLEILLSFL